ncbi:MAG: SGNH/GDSL hydrolase family protein [Streptomycetaceae bacterium]|nr:SGNH/GDSL hydrolase family protein [Streptomycetaceae bacterium]
MSRGGWPALLALLLVVVAVGGFTVSYRHWRSGIDAQVAAAKDSPNRTLRMPRRPPVVLVIGDSYTDGSDMNTGPEWPDIIAKKRGWLLYEDAVGGTGYVNNGQTVRFGAHARIPHDLDVYAPDAVIVAGGLNDRTYSPAAVARAARRDLAELRAGFPHADIVVFSPFSPGPPPADLRTLDAKLRGVARSLGLAYIDVTRDLPASLVGSDGTHPTDQGHEHLAARIDAVLPRGLGR